MDRLSKTFPLRQLQPLLICHAKRLSPFWRLIQLLRLSHQRFALFQSHFLNQRPMLKNGQRDQEFMLMSTENSKLQIPLPITRGLLLSFMMNLSNSPWIVRPPLQLNLPRQGIKTELLSKQLLLKRMLQLISFHARRSLQNSSLPLSRRRKFQRRKLQLLRLRLLKKL